MEFLWRKGEENFLSQSHKNHFPGGKVNSLNSLSSEAMIMEEEGYVKPQKTQKVSNNGKFNFALDLDHHEVKSRNNINSGMSSNFDTPLFPKFEHDLNSPSEPLVNTISDEEKQKLNHTR